MSRTRQAVIHEAGLALQRYQRSVQAFDDTAARVLRVGPTDLRCLDWLSEGPLTAGELAVAAGLRPAATTTLIDRLVEREFVRRVPSDDDRRRVLVELTDEGRRRVWAIYGPLAQEGQSVFNDVTVEQIDAMRAVLDAMTAVTEQHRSELHP